LQNRILALAHRNILIQSTLSGSYFESCTGDVNEEKLKENLLISMAIDAYISRIDGCPCGETTIRLYRVAKSTNQEACKKLLAFLKKAK